MPKKSNANLIGSHDLEMILTLMSKATCSKILTQHELHLFLKVHTWYKRYKWVGGKDISYERKPGKTS